MKQLNGHTCNFDGATGTLVVVAGGPEQLSPPLPRVAPLNPALATMQQGPASTLPPPQPTQKAPAGQVCTGSPQPPAAFTAGPGRGLPSDGMTMNGMQGLMAGITAVPSHGPSSAVGPMNGMQPAPAPVPGPSGARPKSAPSSRSLVPGDTTLVSSMQGKGGPKGKGKNTWQPANGWRSSKLSCKVIVQAELMHSEFPLVLLIEGANSANLDHIRDQNECSVSLHGKGSHHLEPDTGHELNERLFLRIVAEQENLSAALMMVQDLLRSVYGEHQNWCRQRSLPLPSPIEPVIVMEQPSSHNS